jgi:hypothetical protein
MVSNGSLALALSGPGRRRRAAAPQADQDVAG